MAFAFYLPLAKAKNRAEDFIFIMFSIFQLSNSSDASTDPDYL